MGRNILENVTLGKTWTSYIGSIDAALRRAGLWDEELFMLMGMTGMAFHFIVHETVCPSSATVYNWAEEHFAMMDRIGVHSDTYHYFNDRQKNTFSLIQNDAIRRIKASIDRGIPVVVWAPTSILEFGTIVGYDDEDGVFFVHAYGFEEPDPLLYENLGRSEVPILSYQILYQRSPVDREKIYRDSLLFGISEWNKTQHTAPNYASGRKGYENLTNALERGNFNPFGLIYLTHLYADSKECTVRYLNHLTEGSRGLKGLKEATELYRQVAQDFATLAQLMPFRLPHEAKVEPEQAQIALRTFRECAVMEDRAMEIIGSVVAR